MNTSNPTPLRVGATGTLDGWRARVGGRVVMGMEDNGEIYTWNEFNLVDGFGRSATLVSEETENGAEWKLFKPFEPLRPLTATEAASKSVGQTIDLNGKPARITLVDESRVHHIEGVAPPGVEIGDIAHYFNAEAGSRTLVASWTGEDIEFFEGENLPGAKVAAAFGFAPDPTPPAAPRLTASNLDAGTGAAGTTGAALKVAAVVAALIFGVAIYSCNRSTGSTKPPPPRPKQAASNVRLELGARGTLGGRSVTIANHALVEIDRVDSRADRHEYGLAENGGGRALLINGLTGVRTEWHLLIPVTGDPGLAGIDPFGAATLRKGAPVKAGGRTLHVTELFLGKPLATDGPGSAAEWSARQYGFLAQDGNEWLLARWSETAIAFYRGNPLTEAEVLAALQTRATSGK